MYVYIYVYIYISVCVLSFWEPSVRLGLSTDFRRTFSKPLKAFRFSSKPWHSMGHHSRGIVEGAPNNMQSKEKDRSEEAGVRRRLPDSSCATLLFWNTHSQNLTESVQWKISNKKVQRSLSRQMLGFCWLKSCLPHVAIRTVPIPWGCGSTWSPWQINHPWPGAAANSCLRW